MGCLRSFLHREEERGRERKSEDKRVRERKRGEETRRE